MSELCNMLTWKRPARSWSEDGFIHLYVDDLPGVRADDYGNRIVDVGNAPRVLWSAHTDSVHGTPGWQRLAVRGDTVKLATPASECLGADCATGIYILRRLILAGVPGRYVFHRDEESGAHGARYILRETPEVLEGIDYAIAFDRRGYDSVVTHQERRTCSDAFASALATGMELGMRPDPTGIFTDTEVYASVVPECTNVSVGYGHAHSSGEWQAIGFADLIVRAVARLDVDALPVHRVFGDDEGEGDAGWSWNDADGDDDYGDECAICGCRLEPWDFTTSTWDGDEVCEVCTVRLLHRDDPDVVPIRKAG